MYELLCEYIALNKKKTGSSLSEEERRDNGMERPAVWDFFKRAHSFVLEFCDFHNCCQLSPTPLLFGASCLKLKPVPQVLSLVERVRARARAKGSVFIARQSGTFEK